MFKILARVAQLIEHLPSTECREFESHLSCHLNYLIEKLVDDIIIYVIEQDEDDFYMGGPRDYDEQTDAFRFDLDEMIERYKQEFDITFV